MCPGYLFCAVVGAVCVFFKFFVRIGVSFQKESATPLKPKQPDVPPDTSRPPLRSDGVSIVGELSAAADLIRWPRAPELRESEQMAELISAAGYENGEEPMDASAWDDPNCIKPRQTADWAGSACCAKCWAPKLRRRSSMLKEPPPFGAADIYSALEANRMLSGVGELLRPRQEAVNLSPEALREGGEACPPYVPAPSPKLGEASRVPQDPVRRRAAEAEKARQRRNRAGASFLNTG